MTEPSMVQPQPSTPPPLPTPQNHHSSNHLTLLHKTLATAANLANLLPTGTVLAFQALTPSFSNNGTCQLPNKYLTASLIGFCAIVCFLSSFTDSFTVTTDGKLYYGIATFKGLHIFNYDKGEKNMKEELAKFRINCMDFVHAFVSLAVFLIFALMDSNVQSCFFLEAVPTKNAVIMNLPLGAGVLSSFLFIIFPTTRRGIGYADMVTLRK